MDKQKLIECAELLDDTAGNINYEHRLSGGIINMLRHCVDSNTDHGYGVVDSLDIDSGFCALISYNESIKRHMKELDDAIGKLYKLIDGHEMSNDDARYTAEGDEHGEVPMALQDAGRIEVVGGTEQSGFTQGSSTSITVTVKE